MNRQSVCCFKFRGWAENKQKWHIVFKCWWSSLLTWIDSLVSLATESVQCFWHFLKSFNFGCGVMWINWEICNFKSTKKNSKVKISVKWSFTHCSSHWRWLCIYFEEKKVCDLPYDFNWACISLCCLCFMQEHQYNWDDGIHRDHRAGLRPCSDKSSQAQNYKNQGRFATIKSASLVSLTKPYAIICSFLI